MDMDIKFKIIQVCIFMPGFLLSLSCHEAAHAYVAYRFGDPTAKNLGRASLNPIPHIDILGTLIFPIVGMFIGFLFGWGKPVPVDYRNLKNVKRDAMWIAAAGPISNMIFAFILAVIFRAFIYIVGDMSVSETMMTALSFVAIALRQYLYLNLALCIFNLIPIYPLDGGKILYGILPINIADKVDCFTMKYGMIILLVLIFTKAIHWILWPPIEFLGKLLLGA